MLSVEKVSCKFNVIIWLCLKIINGSLFWLHFIYWINRTITVKVLIIIIIINFIIRKFEKLSHLTEMDIFLKWRHVFVMTSLIWKTVVSVCSKDNTATTDYGVSKIVLFDIYYTIVHSKLFII